MEDDTEYAVFLIIFIVVFTGALFFLGGIAYLNEHPIMHSDEGVIKEINTQNLQISSEEFLRVNFTSVRQDMEHAGYNWTREASGSMIVYVANTSDPYIPTNSIKIYLYYDKINNTSYMRGNYISPYGLSSTYLSETKERIKEQMEEVADICGISVDTESIRWTIHYGSSWPTD